MKKNKSKHFITKYKKHIIISILLVTVISILTATLSCRFTSACTVKTDQITNISAKDAYELINNNNNIIIIDIRTPQEYNQGHIKGAINIDFYNNNFKEELNKLDKNKEYLLHCRSGSRSKSSLQTFQELKFQTIYHMNKGIIDWEQQNLPLK